MPIKIFSSINLTFHDYGIIKQSIKLTFNEIVIHLYNFFQTALFTISLSFISSELKRYPLLPVLINHDPSLVLVFKYQLDVFFFTDNF